MAKKGGPISAFRHIREIEGVEIALLDLTLDS